MKLIALWEAFDQELKELSSYFAFSFCLFIMSLMWSVFEFIFISTFFKCFSIRCRYFAENCFVGWDVRTSPVGAVWYIVYNWRWVVPVLVDPQWCVFRLIYDLYVPAFKLSVKSRKSAIILLASIVIWRLFFANIALISFFMISICLGVLWHIARPSSLYQPTLMPRCCN